MAADPKGVVIDFGAHRAAMRASVPDYVASVTRWFETCASGVDGLGKLPAFAFARFDNPDWLRRCDRRVVDAIASWDIRTPLFVTSPTGAGATSNFVARAHDAFEVALQVAELGEKVEEPSFQYLAGYELREAQRRRRPGQARHAVVERAVSAGILILDEVNASHTPSAALFELLDSRARAALPTAIATRMTVQSFGAAFGAATLHRALDGATLVDAYSEAK